MPIVLLENGSHRRRDVAGCDPPLGFHGGKFLSDGVSPHTKR